MNRKDTQSSHRQRGFTLLEVLIALLVFSIGLLGLAGLQVQGLKFNHDSYLRSQATLLGYDLLDRIRANSTTAATYEVNDSAITTVPTNCAASGTTCSTAQMVAFDLYQWKTGIANLLPNGKGKVDEDTVNTSPQNYIITITWDSSEKRDKKTGEATVLSSIFTLRTAP